MRAVIVASGWADGRLAPGARCPAPLLLLAERPIVEHVCAALVGVGVTRVEWVIRSDAPEVAGFLGDGVRWGLAFAHHLVPDAEGGEACAGRLLGTRGPGERLLLGRADRLVELPAPPGAADGAPFVLYGTGAGTRDWRWSGWAVLAGDVGAVRDVTRLESHLDPADAARVSVAEVGPLHTAHDYLEANHATLRELVRGPAGRWGSGVRVVPSARIHPTATLVAPVFVGARCEVAAGATVGPFVTVGDNSVIDRGAVVADAVVLPDTYVAEGARLEAVIADRDRVIVAGADGAAAVTADGPVGSLTDHWPGRTTAALARWRGRAARLVTHLRGLERALRGAVLGTADQPGSPPDPVPIATRTN